MAGNDFQISLTSGGSAVAFTTTGTAVTVKEWTGALSNPNGSLITSSANIWLQYMAVFTAADTTSANPQLYHTGGYVTKYTYDIGANNAETAVEFSYDIGYRNFDAPAVDKIYKKIVSFHEGSQGSMAVFWETEHTSGSFVVDLTLNNSRWESFFPSNAFGRKINIRFYKNDLYELTVKEVQGFYAEEPILI